MKHSSKHYFSRNVERYYIENFMDSIEQTDVKRPGALILDSSLKSATFPKKRYNIKVIKCGKYKQFYVYNYTKTKQEVGWEINKKEPTDKVLKMLYTIEDDLYNKNTVIKKQSSLKQIEERNLIRAKNNMCRLILTNEDKFKTFITLTFSSHITDISIANHEFHKFIAKIKRVFPQLLYVAVPEFQKNGRVHYHFISNISYDNDVVINENISLKELYHKYGNTVNLEPYKEQNIKLSNDENMNDRKIVLRLQDGKWENTKKTYNKKTKNYKIFKTIKYWNNGFSNIMPLNLLCGQNISGYMSKYMLKDIDNRLFGKKRYFFSQKLEKPSVYYLSTDNDIENFVYKTEISTNLIKYQKTYKDKFENSIDFFEIESSEDLYSFHAMPKE